MALHVAVLHLRLHLPGVHSLKEKRSIVKSLLVRIQQRMWVAGAEVEDQELWQMAGLGFAAVGNEVAVLQRSLGQVVNFVEADGRSIVADYRIEIIS